jgi:RNA polymerase sigma-70 factor (ECF subfamily)
MDAFQTFYRHYKDRLFAYLMRMSGDYDLARDLMQEAFTRLLEHYGNERSSPALLFTIGRNAFLDDARKKCRTNALDGEPADDAGNQENAHLVKETYRRVLRAMQELPAEERDILSLAASGELTYREIAAVTGISEANVKVRVHRARVKMKAILKAGET